MTLPKPELTEERVLILAPRGRDAQVVELVLRKEGASTRACAHIAELQSCVEEGGGAALITEEALAEGDVTVLLETLERQRPWSDFPFIVLATKRVGPRPTNAARVLERLGNVVLLERPINAETLSSAVSSALRGRRRQYQARRQLQELERSREYLRILNETLEQRVEERTRERDRIWHVSRDMLGVANAEGVWVSINPAWHRVLDWYYDEIVGRTSEWLEHPDDVEKTRAEIAKLSTGQETLAFENRFRARDGLYRNLSWTGVHVEGLFYCVARDITEEKARTAALAQAEEALRQAQKLEAVGQLTGGVAHDFNNLLTVIKSSTDLLKRPNLAEERRVRYVGAISDTVDRAAKLTGQLLAFARRQALRPEIFDATRSVAAIGEMIGTLTGSRVEIEMHVPEEPCYINADASQFDTALVNMAVNARDAMNGEGRLIITVAVVPELPRLRAHPARTRTYVAVSLTDSGHGIAPEACDRIFEPFFTTKGVGHGTGLGLSQVFGFAKQSGGEIMVESELGKGATFTLYLPRAEPSALSEETPVQPEDAMDGDGTCVLVVEDNRDVGNFSTQTLEELGYSTRWVGNAEEALAQLAENPKAYDVVFSDVVMPGMNGVELGQEIRRLHPGLPVVLTSGYSHVLAREGTHGFELLQKPYSVEALSRALRNAAPRRRRFA
ncbi:MAG: multi-sensor hybrid histidine kinase [Hyphomicrobiales bacterium]|nr:multi-sensor hybrid histidine kinase [Hyphomicrobiales bacterium]